MRCSLGGPSASIWGMVYWLGQASQNCGDLAHDFRIGAVLELAGGERPVRIGVNDDKSSFESTTTAEIAAVTGEKNVERLFPECCLSRCGGLLNSPIDGHKLRVSKPRMDGVLASADPEHVGDGKVWDTREFAQRPPEKQGDFPPTLEKKIEEPVLLASRPLSIRATGFAPARRNRARHEFVGDGFGPGFFERKVTGAKKVREAGGIEDAQRDDFLNLARRRGKRLIIRERACGGEVP